MSEPSASVPASVSQPPGEFRVGHVLSSALTILLRNVLQFGMLSAIASLPYLIFLIVTGTDRAADPLTRAQPIGTSGYFLQFLLGLVLTALCQSLVVFGAFQAMRGRPFRTAESLSRGLARFIPVLGAAFLSSLITGFATLLLIVPGLITMTMLYVAPAACLVEQLGPVDSLSRSADLTKGYRWQIFGLAFLLGLVIVIASVLIGAVLGVMGGSTVITIGGYLWDIVSRAVMAVVTVVAYHDLRVAKEGVDIEHIAAVFD
jgi:hypothetical protein